MFHLEYRLNQEAFRVAVVPPGSILIAPISLMLSSRSRGSMGRRNGRINSKLITGTS
jgi:hypothetical protein